MQFEVECLVCISRRKFLFQIDQGINVLLLLVVFDPCRLVGQIVLLAESDVWDVELNSSAISMEKAVPSSQIIKHLMFVWQAVM